MAITDFLFQGQTPPEVSTTTNSQGQLPLWYSQYLQSLFNRSSAIAGEQFQPYTGQRIAGFSPLQQQAQNYVGANATNWQPIAQQAQTAATRGSQPFSQAGLAQFMNPYATGVSDEISRQGMRLFNEQLMPGLNDQFTMNGQFGSSRHMDFANRGMRDTIESITGQQALANSQNINNAMQNYGNFQGLQLQGASGLNQLAQGQQTMDTRTAAAYDAAGLEQQGLEQRSLDTAYGDFSEQRQWPQQQANFISQIIRGLNAPASTTGTTTAPFNGTMSASPLAQLAGLMATGAGMTSPQRVARGGLIRSNYAHGGPVRHYAGYARGGPVRHYGAGGPVDRSVPPRRTGLLKPPMRISPVAMRARLPSRGGLGAL